MPASIPIPLGTQSYRSRSLPWACQRLVNWYAENGPQAAKTRTPVVLLPRPGLVSFGTAGSGPVRGAREMGGVYFVVSGSSLYKLDSAGTATLIAGTILGTGDVSMDDNGTQLCIVAPDAGVTKNLWVYSSTTGLMTQVVDADFPGSSSVTQLDGYFIHTQNDTSGEFFVSNQLDGMNFDALDFATAESNADQLLRAFADHGEVWMFGTKTIEIWADSGAADFPFSRINTATIERGLLSAYSVCKFDNSIAWVGSDGIVYRANGYSPVRISTHALEKKINETATKTDIRGWSYTEEGHTFYVISSASGVWTMVYDAATDLWAERASFQSESWDATFGVRCYDKWLVAASSGAVYQMSLGTYTDNGTTIRFETTFPVLYANGRRVTMSRLQVEFEQGVGLTAGQGSDPQAMLSWSDDAGKTWSNEHWVSIGALGNYKRRSLWRRMGQFRNRVFKLAITDPVKPVVMGAFADMEAGT
jgi:hypothetical protein